jgi:hypothetical protein
MWPYRGSRIVGEVVADGLKEGRQLDAADGEGVGATPEEGEAAKFDGGDSVGFLRHDVAELPQVGAHRQNHLRARASQQQRVERSTCVSGGTLARMAPPHYLFDDAVED